MPYTSTIESAGGRRVIGVSERTINTLLSNVREEQGIQQERDTSGKPGHTFVNHSNRVLTHSYIKP